MLSSAVTYYINTQLNFNYWYFTAYFPQKIGWRLNKCQLLGTTGLKGGNILWNASYQKGNWYFTGNFPKQSFKKVNKGSNRFWYFTVYFPVFHMIFPHLWHFTGNFPPLSKNVSFTYFTWYFPNWYFTGNFPHSKNASFDNFTWYFPNWYFTRNSPQTWAHRFRQIISY